MRYLFLMIFLLNLALISFVSAQEFCIADGICDSFCSASFPDPDCPGGGGGGGGTGGGGGGTGGGGGGTGGGGGGGGGTGGTGGSLTLTNPLQGSNTFADVMAKVADIAAQIGLPLVVVFIIYAGFLFVSARGDEEKLTKAKTTFFWAVIGALLVVGAFAISLAIQNFAKQL